MIEHLDSASEVQAVLGEVGQPFALVPLELHAVM
jgi:hypothetical protein